MKTELKRVSETQTDVFVEDTLTAVVFNDGPSNCESLLIKDLEKFGKLRVSFLGNLKIQNHEVFLGEDGFLTIKHPWDNSFVA